MEYHLFGLQPLQQWTTHVKQTTDLIYLILFEQPSIVICTRFLFFLIKIQNLKYPIPVHGFLLLAAIEKQSCILSNIYHILNIIHTVYAKEKRRNRIDFQTTQFMKEPEKCREDVCPSAPTL